MGDGRQVDGDLARSEDQALVIDLHGRGTLQHPLGEHQAGRPAGSETPSGDLDALDGTQSDHHAAGIAIPLPFGDQPREALGEALVLVLG